MLNPDGKAAGDILLRLARVSESQRLDTLALVFKVMAEDGSDYSTPSLRGLWSRIGRSVSKREER